MLSEYAEHKKPEDSKEETGKGTSDGDGEGEESDSTPGESKSTSDESKSEQKEDGKKSKGHSEGGTGGSVKKSKEKTEDGEPPKDEHDKTDWSKLDEINEKEFIDKSESDKLDNAIGRLRRKKFKLAKLTETLNGLVTSQRQRSYKMPSTTYCGGGILLKGSTPGRTQLYLVFDASGSMNSEMQTFKDIISQSIPQYAKIKADKYSCGQPYYKGKFKDFMPVYANSGYSDDGDRTIELCWEAEQQGYSPIGVTDGGGQISWSRDKLKQLKRTVLVGDSLEWLEEAKAINPKIQILDI